SLNHYSKGAVMRFLDTHTVGLRREEVSVAWESFSFAPVPQESLTWAAGTHESPEGTIAASWRVSRQQIHAELSIPTGSRCTLALPGAEPETVQGPATVTRATAITASLH